MRTRAITAEEARRIRANSDARHRVIQWALGETGLRVGDLLQLKREDLAHSKDGFSLIQQKTGSPVRVVLSHELRDSMLTLARDKEYVFWSPTKPSQPISRVAVYRYIGRRVNDLYGGGIKAKKQRIGVHSFRKFAAVTWWQQGMSLKEIQTRLGHDKIGTTLIYLQDVLDRRA